MKMEKVNNPAEIKEKIENKIIDWIAVSAGGRLTVVKPPNGFSVADIVVKKRGEYYDDFEIRIQVRECAKKIDEKVFVNKISEGEYEGNPNLYFLFSHFDIVAQDIGEELWFISADKFFEIADVIKTKNNGKVFQFNAPIDANISNVYSKYLINKRDLAKILIKIIDNNGEKHL